MGAAVIVANQGEGLYTIKKTITGLDQAIANTADRRAILELDLTINRNTLGQIWRQVEMHRAAVNALIAQWLNGEITPDAEDGEPIDPETGAPINVGDYTAQVITLTNGVRGGGLSSNAQLAQAAQGHAIYMASQNGISHTGANGSTPGSRINREGYIYSVCGENVSAGQSTPQAVVDAWMNSPAHRANILNDAFVDIGVGLVVDGTAGYRYFWCQCFGAT